MKENVDQLFKTSRNNLEWLEKNYDRLKEEYDNKWIMVQNGKIVASSSNYEEITRALKSCDSKSALIEYVQSEQVAMFF